jgi:DNA repair protein RecO (recombination protein O)
LIPEIVFMNVELTACFILHSRSYLESSLILDIFSREHGRLHLIAKGAKREKSPFSGLLQPYQRLLMAWRGKSELMTLIDVEADIEAYELSDARTIAGFYVNELLVRLLHQHEPHPELFDLYNNAIFDLSVTKPVDAILRIFEKGLLESLGYGLMLDHDVDDGLAIEAGKKYYYLFDSGPMKQTPLTGNYIEITGNSLLALEQGSLQNKTELEESKRLMRFILQSHLGTKPLASRALYKAYTQTT